MQYCGTSTLAVRFRRDGKKHTRDTGVKPPLPTTEDDLRHVDWRSAVRARMRRSMLKISTSHSLRCCASSRQIVPHGSTRRFDFGGPSRKFDDAHVAMRTQRDQSHANLFRSIGRARNMLCALPEMATFQCSCSEPLKLLHAGTRRVQLTVSRIVRHRRTHDTTLSVREFSRCSFPRNPKVRLPRRPNPRSPMPPNRMEPAHQPSLPARRSELHQQRSPTPVRSRSQRRNRRRR